MRVGTERVLGLLELGGTCAGRGGGKSRDSRCESVASIPELSSGWTRVSDR